MPDDETPSQQQTPRNLAMQQLQNGQRGVSSSGPPAPGSGFTGQAETAPAGAVLDPTAAAPADGSSPAAPVLQTAPAGAVPPPVSGTPGQMRLLRFPARRQGFAKRQRVEAPNTAPSDPPIANTANTAASAPPPTTAATEPSAEPSAEPQRADLDMSADAKCEKCLDCLKTIPSTCGDGNPADCTCDRCGICFALTTRQDNRQILQCGHAT